MLCSGIPEMDEPHIQAFSPHISRDLADYQNSQPVIPTATLLEHALLAQGFMGISKVAFPRRLQLPNRDSTGAKLSNAIKCRCRVIYHADRQDRLRDSLKNTACGAPHRGGRCRDTRRHRYRAPIFDGIEDSHPACSSTVCAPRRDARRSERPITDGRREPPRANSTLATLDRGVAAGNRRRSKSR